VRNHVPRYWQAAAWHDPARALLTLPLGEQVMNVRTNFTDAFTTTLIGLLLWQLFLGSPTDSGLAWIARTIVLFPLSYAGWYSYRNRFRLAATVTRSDSPATVTRSDSPAPRVRFYSAHFTGAGAATCDDCGTTWVLWDDPEEVTGHACDRSRIDDDEH
jgi:hypothetical protein